jgi:hypothetical protein
MGNNGELKDKYFTDFIYLFLIFAVNILYYSYFINKLPDFYADDYYIFTIVKNFLSTGIFISPNEYHYLFWRPVLFFTFCLDNIIAGNDSVFIKYISLSLHLLTIIFVYFTVIKLFNISKFLYPKYLIFLITLALSLHPVHYKCIIWIAQKNALIMELFFVIAFFCVLKYIESNKTRYLFLTVMSFIVSLLCKQNAASFPFILFALFLLYRNNIDKNKEFKIKLTIISIFIILIAYSTAISFYFNDLNVLYFFEYFYKKPFVIISSVLYYLIPYKFSEIYYFFVDNYIVSIILFLLSLLLILTAVFHFKKYKFQKFIIPIFILIISFFPQILISNEFRNLNIQILILFILTSLLLLYRHKYILKILLIYFTLIYPFSAFQEADKDIILNDKNKQSVSEFIKINKSTLNFSTILCSIEGPEHLPYIYYYIENNYFGKHHFDYLRILLLIRDDKIVSSNLNTEMIKVTKNNDTLTFSTIQDFVEFMVYKDVPAINIKKSPFSRGYKEFQYVLTPDLRRKNLIYYNGISWETVK